MNTSGSVRQRSGRSRLAWLLAACALAATGCVDFDRETMVFVFPPDSQEVRGLLIYEGLCVQGKDPDDLDSAQKQLTGFVTEQKEFCLGDNFLLHFSLVDTDNDDLPTKLQKQFLRKHVMIKNGAFFLNPDGKLCGYQTVTIKDREAFVRDLNAFASAGFTAMATEYLADESKRAPWYDEETLRRLQKAAGANFAWFKLEPGRASFTAPATPQAIQRVKADLFGLNNLDQLRKRLAEPDNRADVDPATPTKAQATQRTLDFLEARTRLLSDGPWSFDQRADQLSIGLGVGGGAPIRLAAYTSSPGGRRDELLAHARTLKAPFKKDLTADKLAAEFVKGKGTLPPP